MKTTRKTQVKKAVRRKVGIKRPNATKSILDITALFPTKRKVGRPQTTAGMKCICGHNIMKHNTFRGEGKSFGCIKCECQRFRSKKK